MSITAQGDLGAKPPTRYNPEAKAWDIKDYRSVIPANQHFAVPDGRPEAGFIADSLEGVADGSEPALVAVLQ